ncbi:MAG TPA: hypothetical protein VL137_17290, partial [Polyangiaceae bacterium]|nr:hypothetical protein [Polyangiaceae bacterium]
TANWKRPFAVTPNKLILPFEGLKGAAGTPLLYFCAATGRCKENLRIGVGKSCAIFPAVAAR